MSPKLRLFSLPFVNKTKFQHNLTLSTMIFLSVTLISLQCPAQQTTPNQPGSQTQNTVASAKAASNFTSVTIPAGVSIALVLTHPIQSRFIHRGDDVYAQVVSPVTAGNEVVIPAGTLIQAKVDKLGRNGSRGELTLQSMSVIFPDGYIAPVAGPLTWQSDQGYALKDPGSGRGGAALGLVGAGVGLGALIGHSVGSSQSTITTTIPPGCNTAFPNCLSNSMVVPGRKGIDTGIGVTVGAAAGAIGAAVLLASSHHFFLDVGAPIETVLSHPLKLEGDQVSQAIKDSEQMPVPEQPIEPRPVPPPVTNSGTCWTPGTPGTPGTDIPGTPPIGNSPGTPSIHIPGIPPTPPTAYPCP
jgi:hypothetical protein